MSSEKRYGRLTRDDMSLVLSLLPVLEQERRELQTRIAQQPDKLSELLAPGFAWAHLYELSFPQFLQAFLIVAGLRGEVERIARQPDPVGALHTLFVESNGLEDWQGGEGGKYTTGDLIGYLHALIGNLDCLLIYGCYLNDLLAQARQGNLDALLDAIRIDPTVVTTALGRNLISLSVITGERKLLDGIQKALTGKTGRQARYLKRFRILMQLLHEAGALNLPTRDLVPLVFEQKAYTQDPGAAKNVSELIRKAKLLKRSAISK